MDSPTPTHLRQGQAGTYSVPSHTNTPAISVIIPNFNHTSFIRGAIESVLDQTYRSYEIIVVDDGSTDNSHEVVTSYGRKVRYIRQENQGLAGARNTGILASRGEIIGLLDADDQWLPDFLAKMVSLTNRHPEAAVYYCCALGMDERDRELPQVFGGPAVPSEMVYSLLLRANFIIPSTTLLRRSIILAAGLFDRELRSCEDWDLWLRLLPKQLFVGTSECLVRYRLHGSSLSANLSGMHKAAMAVIEKNFGPDDGRKHDWSPEKLRAYGGLYRYFALTSVHRQNNWEVCARYISLALQFDPTLAADLDLFYDLSMGNQLPGYRGTPYRLCLTHNARKLIRILDDIFKYPIAPELSSLRRRTFGTAYFALGLVAYNTAQFPMSRHYMLKALFFRPGLCMDHRVSGDLAKSLLGGFLRARLKTLRQRLLRKMRRKDHFEKEDLQQAMEPEAKRNV